MNPLGLNVWNFVLNAFYYSITSIHKSKSFDTVMTIKIVVLIPLKFLIFNLFNRNILEWAFSIVEMDKAEKTKLNRIR